MLAKMIEDRIAYLTSTIKSMKRYLKKAPSGFMYSTTRKGHTYRFLRTRKPDGRYKTKHIDPLNTPLLTTYADKSLCRKMVPVLEKELNQLKCIKTEILKECESQSIRNSAEYDRFASPEFLHHASIAKRWAEEPYASSSLPIDENRDHKTVTGIYVRSKNEKILGDCITRCGYFYRYEMRVLLQNGDYRYPDFAVYSPYTGRILWIELLGMMDDPEYAQKNIRKIKDYGRIGIIPGINLLTVYDLPGVPFDEEVFEQSLEHMLRCN